MNIEYSDLIKKIPVNLLDELSAKYKINTYNHKLTGQSLFTILLYNICDPNEISLRAIEENFDSHNLGIYHKNKRLRASKSGIATRLKMVDYRFFEAIFKNLKEIYVPLLPEVAQNNIKRFDSTSITLSGKLLHCGFGVARGVQKEVKLSIGFGRLPEHVRFGTARSDQSEEIALKEAIKEASLSSKDIVVFDRGIAARKTFAEFSRMGINFVTRLNDKAKYKILSTDSSAINQETSSVTILGDHIVLLRSKNGIVKTKFRLVCARTKKDGKTLYFLTNLTNIDATDVTDIYKARWEIEVFFKFIKQHLNAKHFLSRNLNGIKVVCYMIMIAALLMLTFKIVNKIESFKIAKMRFVERLRRAITYELIVLHQHQPYRFITQFGF